MTMTVQRPAELTLVRDGGQFALYTPSPDGYALLVSGPDSEGVALKVAGALHPEIRLIEDAPHLRHGGTWAQTTSSLRPSTGRERLEAEIAALEAEATRRERDAAYSGAWNDGGATGLRAQAQSLRHALEVLAQD